MLMGYWVDAVDAPLTVEDFIAGVRADRVSELLIDMSIVGEELWCFDTEGFPTSVGEINPADARKWGQVGELLVDEDERDAFLVYCDNMMVSLSEIDEAVVQDFREAYAGQWYKLSDFVAETVEDIDNIPEPYRYYIDYEAMARDWELNGDVWTDGKHVFWNR
jgi:antirestriction protein